SLLTSESVDFLMSQKDGANYVVLYQCLCLKLVNNDGVLGKTLGEVLVPYDVNKIFRETKGWFSIDTIRVALEIYKNLGLIYQLENGLYRITNFENLIGSETNAAERMRIIRANKERTKSEHCSPDIDIDIRDKRLDIDIRERNIKEDKTRLNEIKAKNGFAGELYLRLVYCNYVSLYELDIDDYINLFNSYLENYELVDVKVKLDYFIKTICHYSPTGKNDKQGKPIFAYIYEEEEPIANKFTYLKQAMDNSWKKL
ncbi:MAG: phage replisome organizer N-terminal domain-containing protein, partial [Christensenellales bacterium]